MNLRRDERGQSAVVALLFLTALLAMSAAVLDVGSWFRADRHAQSVADAAALAGAQALPADPATARALAVEYAKKNGGGDLAPGEVEISSSDATSPNDTITVALERPAPGFFSRVFSIDSIKVGATAAARAFRPGEVRWVAPIVVNEDHPLLSGDDCPCFGPDYPTTLDLGKTDAPGAFDMLNLDSDDPSGTAGASTLATWIEDGFDQYLPVGGYYSSPGAKFNASSIQAALQDRYDTELLFPVYDTLTLQGSNATYHIIGWVGFHLTDAHGVSGSHGTLSGWFTRVIWDGLDAVAGGDPGDDFGMRAVQLVQ